MKNGRLPLYLYLQLFAIINLMSFSIGAEIGAYTITDEIGKGGMATVYKAHHNKLARDVAIKVMHPAYSGEETFLRRFEREAQVVARLEHPHIVPIYDYAVHEGHPYLVMRYIKGETLKDRLNEGKLSKHEILRLTNAITNGLDYAHGEGVLHRDIKPSNILLTAGRGVYITDFGLARVMQSGESTLSQGMIMGTPHYISPEQAKGVSELNGRADIYSFGIVLYEMIVGCVPFRADSDFSIIHSQIFDAPPLPSSINDNINPRLEMVLLKVLEKEPENRFNTAGEMATALHHALDDMPSDISPIGAAALPDYTPVAMTQVKTDAPPSSPSLPETLSPEEDSSETSAPKTRAGKQTAVWIIGGIIGGIILCISLLLAIGAMNENSNNGDDGEDTAVNTSPAIADVPPATADMPQEDAPPHNSNMIFVPIGTERLRPLDKLLKLAENNPQDPVLMTELALAHLKNDDWDSAAELVEVRFARAKTTAVFVQTAEVLLENGRIDLAQLVLEEAMYKFNEIPHNLANGEVQRPLLMIYIWYEDTDNVEDLHKEIRSISTPTPELEALVPLSKAYLMAANNNTADAEALLWDSINNDDYLYPADGYVLLSMLYNRMKSYDNETLMLQFASESEPPGWLEMVIESLKN